MKKINKKIFEVANIDFDGIKTALKNYLRDETSFGDVDFEGNNASVLLDVLAYATHYNVLYYNFSLNEVFLDTASKRSSVVSLAQMLGYLPQGYHSARAKVRFVVQGITSVLPSVDRLVLQPGVTLRAVGNNDEVFNFVTIESHIGHRIGTTNDFLFDNVEVVEGTPHQHRFLVNGFSRFKLQTSNIDVSTLKVKVYASRTLTGGEFYKPAKQFSRLTSDSKVYFIHETYDNSYEIMFGDGIIGKALPANGVVEVTYLTSSGKRANGIKTFVAEISDASLLYGGSINSVITIEPSYNGGDPQTTDTIRTIAPFMWQTQGRAVTEDDYRAILLQECPFIKDVIVWGGERMNPPQYGKVFLAVMLRGSIDIDETLSNAQRQMINDVLRRHRIMTLTHEFISPQVYFLEPNVRLVVDLSQTTNDLSTIIANVRAAMLIYNDEKLGRFNVELLYSDLIDTIHRVDTAIVDVRTEWKIKTAVNFVVNQPYRYNIKFGNRINIGYRTVRTGEFTSEFGDRCFVFNEYDGSMTMYRFENGEFVAKRPNIGRVDYETGDVEFEANVNRSKDFNWFVSAELENTSVQVAAPNSILAFDPYNINVTAIPK